VIYIGPYSRLVYRAWYSPAWKNHVGPTSYTAAISNLRRKRRHDAVTASDWGHHKASRRPVDGFRPPTGPLSGAVQSRSRPGAPLCDSEDDALALSSLITDSRMDRSIIDSDGYGHRRGARWSNGELSERVRPNGI